MPPSAGRPFRPFSRSPRPPDPTHLHPSGSQDGNKVLGRLHALFTPSDGASSSELTHIELPLSPQLSVQDVDDPIAGPSRTSTAIPTDAEAMVSKDRNAIKVLVVTWNMGDALVRTAQAMQCSAETLCVAKRRPGSTPRRSAQVSTARHDIRRSPRATGGT